MVSTEQNADSDDCELLPSVDGFLAKHHGSEDSFLSWLSIPLIAFGHTSHLSSAVLHPH